MNYRDYNGSTVDYDRDTGLLDSGNRLYNRSHGYSHANPNVDWDDYDGDYEPDHFDEDCW